MKKMLVLLTAVIAFQVFASDPAPVRSVDLLSHVGCDLFDGDSLSGTNPVFDIACDVAPVDAAQFPGAMARATVGGDPVWGQRGYAQMSAVDELEFFYADSQINLRFYQRLDELNAPPFDPVLVPLLWVTRGSAEVSDPANFQAWSQFVNEFGNSVATYLFGDDLSFERLRPYQVGTGYEVPLTLFAECFMQAQIGVASRCDYQVDAYPILDQARFDDTYGSDSFRLQDYYALRFSPGVEIVPDMDEDSVLDGGDNCTFRANANQRDTDNDGFGNRCDADFNNDCVVNVVDLGLMRAGFFSPDPLLDLDGDGQVNTSDLGVMRTLFHQAPGPSAASADCRPPVTSIG
ncbi:MAG: thrombospondin type 3 repeat-containing protein [Gammaproteobacteria bacterium]